MVQRCDGNMVRWFGGSMVKDPGLMFVKCIINIQHLS
jgi:hypothetical protein